MESIETGLAAEVPVEDVAGDAGTSAGGVARTANVTLTKETTVAGLRMGDLDFDGERSPWTTGNCYCWPTAKPIIGGVMVCAAEAYQLGRPERRQLANNIIDVGTTSRTPSMSTVRRRCFR